MEPVRSSLGGGIVATIVLLAFLLVADLGRPVGLGRHHEPSRFLSSRRKDDEV